VPTYDGDRLVTFGKKPTRFRVGLFLTEKEIDNCLKAANYHKTKLRHLVYKKLSPRCWILLNIGTSSIIQSYKSKEDLLCHVDEWMRIENQHPIDCY
jgi:hypothetical protein